MIWVCPQCGRVTVQPDTAVQAVCYAYGRHPGREQAVLMERQEDE